MKIENWQRVAAQERGPDWIGDLADDCTARWAGLILRAESMDRSRWWWAVKDLTSGVDIEFVQHRCEEMPFRRCRTMRRRKSG
jgi:hypothetical protein